MKLFFRTFYCKHQFELIVRLVILKNLYIFFCRMERLLEFIELIERLQLTLINVYDSSYNNKTLLTTQTSKEASHLKVSQFFRCSLDSWDCTKHTSQSPSSSSLMRLKLETVLLEKKFRSLRTLEPFLTNQRIHANCSKHTLYGLKSIHFSTFEVVATLACI